MERVEPAVIGRQFVHQYYTLLHSQPGEIHRFYLEQSIFVHASETGQDDSVVGQQAIFDRISALNFVNCCTRIRQVDAYASVDETIVIQVVGEISNNQEPLRPFVQTFVLVHQGANKYYVHNDIFRYQDFIVEPEASESVQDGHVHETEEPVSLVGEKPQEAVTSQPVYFSEMSNGPPTVVDVSNVGLTADDDSVEHASAPQSSLLSGGEEEDAPVHQPAPAVESNVGSGFAEEASHMQKEPERKSFSWANVAGGKKSSQPPAQAAPVRAPSPSPLPSASGLPQRQARRNPNVDNFSSRGPPANGRSGPRGGRPGELPDNQQLFVSSLPTSVEGDEIKKAFSPYGNVVDVNIRNIQKGGSVICFVSFDSADDVSRILKESPEIQVQGLTLRIEEKRPQRSGRAGGPAGRGGRGGGSSERGRGAGRSRGGNDRR